jgi:hypothetical protein
VGGHNRESTTTAVRWNPGILSSAVDAKGSRCRLLMKHIMEFADKMARGQAIDGLENQSCQLVMYPSRKGYSVELAQFFLVLTATVNQGGKLAHEKKHNF